MIDEGISNEYQTSRVERERSIMANRLTLRFNEIGIQGSRENAIINVREIYKKFDQPKLHTHGKLIYDILCNYSFPKIEEEINGHINSKAYFILGTLSTTKPRISLPGYQFPIEFVMDRINIIFERLNSSNIDVVNGSLMLISHIIFLNNSFVESTVQQILDLGIVDKLYELSGESYAPLVFEKLRNKGKYDLLEDENRIEMLPEYFEGFLKNEYPKCVSAAVKFLSMLECYEIIINNAPYILNLDITRTGASDAIKTVLNILLQQDGVDPELIPEIFNVIKSAKTKTIAKPALELVWRAWESLVDDDRKEIMDLLYYCAEDAPMAVGAAALPFLVLSLSPSALDLRQLAAFIKFLEHTDDSSVKHALAGVQAFLGGAAGTELEEEAAAMVEDAFSTIEGLCGSENEKVSEIAMLICEAIAA